MAEIARRLEIQYQHAYGVLKQSGTLPPRRFGKEPVAEAAGRARIAPKPPLSIDELAPSFAFAGRWILTGAGEIALDRPATKAIGVYAFAMDGIAVYVGVATMGIAGRLHFYAKPGSTQRTSLRLNQMIKTELATRPFVDIYTAEPGDLEWNGLPVHGSAGLELGLIRKYALPWNIRSAG